MVNLFINTARVVAVEEKPFQLTIKPPTADAMKDQLDKAGHIALYVNFDFAKATLKPDAAPVIDQIVALLKHNPDLKVSIEGHTDSIGGHDYNMKLSQDRAAGVVAAVEKAGIRHATRLASAGIRTRAADRIERHRRRPRQKPPRRTGEGGLTLTAVIAMGAAAKRCTIMPASDSAAGGNGWTGTRASTATCS